MFDFYISPSEIADQVRDLVALQDRQRRAATDARFATMRKAMPPCPSARPAAPTWPDGAEIERMAKSSPVTTEEAFSACRRMAVEGDRRRLAEARTLAHQKFARANALLAEKARTGVIGGLEAARGQAQLARIAMRLPR